MGGRDQRLEIGIWDWRLANSQLQIAMTHIDELMMDSLDGVITPADRAVLDAHLAQNPDAQLAFEQMMRVDMALRETPAVSAPADFTHKVMTQARAMPIAKPLSGSHIAAIIAANSVLVGSVWIMMAALLLGLGLFASQLPALQPVFALVRAVSTYMRDALGLVSAATRAWGAQPIAWITVLAAFALVATWIGVMAKVLRPAQQYASR
jgi:anti-sigma factor RsiW